MKEGVTKLHLIVKLHCKITSPTCSTCLVLSWWTTYKSSLQQGPTTKHLKSRSPFREDLITKVSLITTWASCYFRSHLLQPRHRCSNISVKFIHRLVLTLKAFPLVTLKVKTYCLKKLSGQTGFCWNKITVWSYSWDPSSAVRYHQLFINVL